MVVSVGSSGFRGQSTSRQQLWSDFATPQQRTNCRSSALRTFIVPDAEVTEPKVVREKYSCQTADSKRYVTSHTQIACDTHDWYRWWGCFCCGGGGCLIGLACEADRSGGASPRDPTECVDISARVETGMWWRQ